MSPDDYKLRPVMPSDLSLLRSWRRRPHVSRWWGKAELEPEEEKLADARIAMWIVELVDRPFAFAQDYDPHAWEGHPFAHLPAGSRGIDQYIGEPDMIGCGHGSNFVRKHAEALFSAGAPAVGTDPHPDNIAARRAYENAGFTAVGGPICTLWGEAILMERWCS
jgi:aminoglycoside 6'-N-acetyltransferase